VRRDGRVAVWNGPFPAVGYEYPSDETNVVALADGGAAYLDGAGGVTTVPRNLHVIRPEGLTNIVAVSAAANHVLALRNDGKLFAWGKTLANPPLNELTNVPPHLTNVIAMAAGRQANMVAVGNGSPRFVDEMGPVVARKGHAFYLNAFAVAQPPISYRWLKNGEPVANGVGPILKLDAVSAADAGLYTVEIGNALGSITGLVATVTVETPASILGDPEDVSVRAGTPAHFIASATGDPLPSVQWQFNGTNIADANAYSLTVPMAWPWDAGDYRIVVSNFTGFATSQVARLTVLPGIVFQIPENNGGLGPDGFRFRVEGLLPNGPAILYGSTNLVDWIPLWTNAPTSGFFDWTDPGATNRAHRFYKVVELPSP
jgi:hypothetical protein